MSNAPTTSALISLSFADKFGAHYLAPVADVSIGILDAMIDTQNKLGQIEWIEITEGYVLGGLIETGQRLAIYRSDLPNDVDEYVSDWLGEGN